MSLVITIFSPGNGIRFYSAALNARTESIVSGPAQDFTAFISTVDSYAERAKRGGLKLQLEYHGLEPSVYERKALDDMLARKTGAEPRSAIHG